MAWASKTENGKTAAGYCATVDEAKAEIEKMCVAPSPAASDELMDRIQNADRAIDALRVTASPTPENAHLDLIVPTVIRLSCNDGCEHNEECEQEKIEGYLRDVLPKLVQAARDSAVSETIEAAVNCIPLSGISSDKIKQIKAAIREISPATSQKGKP